ncbi:MAG: GYF domain-containing protein [Anderseniella sp.]|jgi:hypothetical protein|nr:GYF domain-containing protein [Anderseniella sp.]
MPIEQAEWFVIRSEWKSDALTLQTLRELIERGILTKNDLIWRMGWRDWVGVDDVVAAFPQLLGKEQPHLQVDNRHALTDSKHATIKNKIYHELVSYSAITGYLWIVLFMLWLHEIIILDQHGIAGNEHQSLIVNALILGKVILIAEVLRLGTKIKFNLPIISIIVRSLLFAIALMCFHLLEHAALALWHGESALSAMTDMSHLQQNILVVSIMTVALMPYHAFKAIQELVPDINILWHVMGVGQSCPRRPD